METLNEQIFKGNATIMDLKSENQQLTEKLNALFEEKD